jgi:antitoxin component YwqK of YwqJK toxin-antitoxin module
MSEPIIFNDVDFQFSEQNILSSLKYKDEPFTGKLFIAGDCDKGNEVIDYQHGTAHGHDVALYPDGKLFADSIYDHGNCISKKEWYRDGTPKKEWDKANERFWDLDGALAKDSTRWFYKNGQPIEEQSQQYTSYFSPKGDLAIKTANISFGHGHNYNISYYYDHVLICCFEELFTNYYPELDEHFSRHQLLPGWLSAAYQEDRNLSYHLMDCLVNHPTAQTRETAVQLKTTAQEVEHLQAQSCHLHPTEPDHIIVKLNFDTRF